MTALFSRGDAYERFMGRWSRRLAPRVIDFAQVADSDRVLDAGCGTGALSCVLLETFPSARVTGVDPSVDFIQHARARAASDRARFVVGDAQALELPTAAFDKSLASLVMNFIPDPAKALREIIRVTKPGGVIAVAVWDYGDGMQMLRAFWDEAAALDPSVGPRDERHMPLCRRGELATLLGAEGLERVDEQPLTVELSFASFEDYWAPFLGAQGPAGAYAATLDEQQRGALEARLRARLLGSRDDGPFTLEARAWTARGLNAEG